MNRYHLKNRLRVTNVDFLNGSGYRYLEREPSILYSQFPPMECSRLLAEGEADLALIPIVEFAHMGGYRPLPFGIATDGPVASVLLLSNVPLQDLEEVYLDPASQTSVVLLKTLLREFSPDVSARLNLRRGAISEVRTRSAGALIIGDSALEERANFSHCLDLGEWWKEKTGLPFVFAIWAGRYEKIDDDTAIEIDAIFRKSISYQALFARDWAEKRNSNREAAAQYVSENIRCILNEQEIAGANLFFQLAHEHGSIPFAKIEFDSAEPNSNRIAPHVHARTATALFHDATTKKRLSLYDLRLFLEELPESHILLAADLCRVAHALESVNDVYRNFEIVLSNVSVSMKQPMGEFVRPGDSHGFVLSAENVLEKIESIPRIHHRQVTLTCGIHPELDLRYFCDMITRIKHEFRGRLAALSSEHVAFLSQNTGAPISEIVSKLHAAGLDLLGDRSYHLLVERSRRRVGDVDFTAEEVIEVHRQAHLAGLQSVAAFPVTPGTSWRDRLAHLFKLRRLQDDTGGFAYLSCEPLLGTEEYGSKPLSESEYLRAVATARLLVDNIRVIESTPVGFGTPIAEISLHCGADTSIGAL